MSPFFRTLFSSRTIDSELLDELPLVQLEVGIAEDADFEALLQHLYHDEPLNAASSFHQTARILRACTQYDFPQVRKLALDRLQALYPRRPVPFECNAWQYIPEASQLALDCSAREVLPALLYAMVTTTDFDLEEALHEHPIISIGNPVNKEIIPHTSQRDLHRLCAKLMNSIMDHFAPVLFTVPTGSHMECTGVFADHWMTYAIQPALDDSGVYKPLETLKKIQEVDWQSLGLCDECYADKQREWEAEAEDIWSRMSGWADPDSYFTNSHSVQY